MTLGAGLMNHLVSSFLRDSSLAWYILCAIIMTDLKPEEEPRCAWARLYILGQGQLAAKAKCFSETQENVDWS